MLLQTFRLKFRNIFPFGCHAMWRFLLKTGAVAFGGVSTYSLYSKLTSDEEGDLRQNLPILKIPDRKEQLKFLRESEFDILVVGGGATGTGIALVLINICCISQTYNLNRTELQGV
jgi:hypothetical protein